MYVASIVISIGCNKWTWTWTWICTMHHWLMDAHDHRSSIP